jgi:hypothetical protein
VTSSACRSFGAFVFPQSFTRPHRTEPIKLRASDEFPQAAVVRHQLVEARVPVSVIIAKIEEDKNEPTPSEAYPLYRDSRTVGFQTVTSGWQPRPPPWGCHEVAFWHFRNSLQICSGVIFTLYFQTLLDGFGDLLPGKRFH